MLEIESMHEFADHDCHRNEVMVDLRIDFGDMAIDKDGNEGRYTKFGVGMLSYYTDERKLEDANYSFYEQCCKCNSRWIKGVDEQTEKLKMVASYSRVTNLMQGFRQIAGNAEKQCKICQCSIYTDGVV
jgi:hypothetical protein